MSYSVKETPWPMAVGQLRGLLLLSQNRASVLFGRPSFRKPQAEDERVPVVSANSCLYLDSLHTRFLPLSRVSFSSLLARSLSLSLSLARPSLVSEGASRARTELLRGARHPAWLSVPISRSLSLSLSLSVSLSLCLTQTPSLFLFLSLSQGETSEFASSLAVASPAFSATPAATPNKLP